MAENKKEFRSLGSLGPGIIIKMRRFSFLTCCSGGKFAFINNKTQQSSVFCLKI